MLAESFITKHSGEMQNFETERWEKIDEYPNYSVSDAGRIRVDNYRRVGVIKIMKQKKHKQGYNEICVSKDGIKKTLLIHRLVAATFIPNTYNKQEVNHKNGDKGDNRVTNLEWVTPSENTRHASRIGAKGKLNGADVVKIRELYANGALNQSEIARMFGIKSHTANQIIRHKRWGWL